MYLKSLSIKGFKSFAHSTTLEFEPGVSVIVGPNGSGKSNVVDAIGWVLGAQAPSAVRSTKMDDVIFAGTQSLPALGRAEVSLTVDNSSGVLPLDLTEVTISRTLFRTGESEYAMNGVPCRLLDIQELLSDAGVGRQQHVIVSQGQIDGVLNARPEDRRLVIEEAAGILKYRKRKEKAERRLASTEGNLTRLQDLLREVRRQLRPLERQAEAARRHSAVVSELTALRVHLAGREIAALESRLEVAESDRAEMAGAEAKLRQHLADLDRQVLAAERKLSAMGAHDLGDLLALFESLGERARGQLAVLGERRRSVEREREVFIDQEVVATLESEATRLRGELVEVDRLEEALEPLERSLHDDERVHQAEQHDFERELADRTQQQQLPLAVAVSPGPPPAQPGASAEPPGASREELIRRLQGAQRERAEAEEELRGAEVASRDARGEEQTWRARAEALALALDESRTSPAFDEISEIPGVAGRLMDLTETEPGWEKAVQAALSGSLGALVVESPDAARAVIERVGDRSATVLPLGIDRPEVAVPPAGVPLRAHVRSSTPGVEELLEALLAGVVAVNGWEAAVEVALRHPSTIVVTRAGDRFGPSGWRVGSASADLDAALEEARTQAEESSAKARAAALRLASARSHAEIARRREVELSRQLGRAFDDARAALEARARELAARRADLEVRRASLAERRQLLMGRLAELESRLGAHGEQREAAGERLEFLERQSDAVERLVAFVESRIRDIDEAVSRLREQRRQQSAATREVTGQLQALRDSRSGAEGELGELRERIQRSEIEHAEIALRLETAIEALRRDLSTEPEQAKAAHCPELPDAIGAAARVRELERELRIMGPINPLALQEFESLQVRHEFLVSQIDDVKRTRRDLFKIVREIDREIMSVFAAAFADVAESFQVLFETLFPGGRGRLVLTDPDNLLDTGIEVEARPSGKNVKKLSLLSGGERSLTALAFLFAVFRSRPSPFYVMDEVEAALDDINLHRFLELVGEFRRDAQLIIVSHQKRTMEAADCLYGVSMQPGGSSKVVSERIADVELV